MDFQLELVHGVRVVTVATGSPIPLRTYRGILSALGYAERAISREELVAKVWPDTPASVARNRLRVALAKLRSLMPGAIVESHHGLSLDPDVISVDATAVRHALAQAQNHVTLAEERNELMRVLATLGDPKTFETDMPGAASFGESIARSALRVHELSMEMSLVEDAAYGARAATFYWPDSVEAWAAYLHTNWMLGSGAAAIEDASARAPKRVHSDGKVQDALKQARTPAPRQRDRVTSDRQNFWTEVLVSLENSRPDLMRQILSAPEALAVSGKQPRLMHDALEKATPLDVENRDLVWERSAARLIGLKAWLGDADGVLQHAEKVLAISENDTILRAVWNGCAVAHSLNRDWDKAYEALDRTHEYARKLDSAMYQITTVGNRAFFKMQQARFEEAEADYATTFARLTEIDTPQARFELAIARGNSALISVFQRDWDKAFARLDAGIKARTMDGSPLQMGVLQAAMAVAMVHLHRYDGVGSLMRLAFLDAFASDSDRTQQFTFELAAVAIDGLGDRAFARSLADWTSAWRDRIRAPRSEAELGLLTDILEAPSTSPLAGEPNEVGNQTMKRLRALIARSLSS